MAGKYQQGHSAHRNRYRKPKSGRSIGSLIFPALLIGASAISFGWASGVKPELSAAPLMAMLPGSGCNIKGNVSIDTGERIYHVPGQKFYQGTRISHQHGERWFCSEEEARRAGWRKSRQ